MSSLTILRVLLSVCLLTPLWAEVPTAALAGLMYIRTFIIFHDTVHGTMFTKFRFAHWIMNASGLLILSPAPIRKESYDDRHAVATWSTTRRFHVTRSM